MSPVRDRGKGSPSPAGQSPTKKKVTIQSGSKSQANLAGSPGGAKKDQSSGNQEAPARGKATRYKNSILRESYEVEKA